MQVIHSSMHLMESLTTQKFNRPHSNVTFEILKYVKPQFFLR